jgi:site-specific DNA recombinase
MSTIFGYIRVSTEKQRLGGTSLDNQRQTIIDYCKSNNLYIEPENIYSDSDSGSNDDRVNLTLLRNKLKLEKSVKHLIVYSIDRLTRDVLFGEIISREVAEHGGSIVSVSQGFNDADPSGRMTRQLLTVVAENERLNILSRMAFGRKRRKDEGLFCGGKAPMGFESVGNANQRGFGKLNVNSKEREAMTLMVVLHNGGNSFRNIAKQLTEKGFFTRKGTPFNPGSIKKVIEAMDAE